MIINAVEYLDRTAQRFPDRPAVADTQREYSFSEIQDCAKKIATLIIQKTEAFNKPVAVFMPKDADCLTSFLGVLYSGNYYVPLYPKSPKERIEKVLGVLEGAAVLTTDKLAESIREFNLGGATLMTIDAAFDENAERDDHKIAERTHRIIDTDPIYIKFTSGSTGVPKGVVLPHRAVIDYTEWSRDYFEITSEDVIGNQAPFYFDVSVQDIYLMCATGAQLVIIPEQHFSFPAQLIEFIAKYRISFFCWVPSMLVKVANLDLLDGADTRHLRMISVLGEVMPTKHFKYWAAHCPDATLVNLYGPTEAAVASTFYRLDREFDDAEPLPIGFPCSSWPPPWPAAPWCGISPK